MKIAIIGASRGIGKRLLELALEAGHEVTALVRTPEKITLKDAHLHLVGGDILDPDSVSTVTAGQDGIAVCIGVPPTGKPITVFSQGTRNVLASLEPDFRPTLIVVTGIGAGESRGHGSFFYDRLVLPWILNTIYQDKNRQENLVKKSNARWIIIRPGFLTNGLRTEQYRVVEDLTGIRAGKISRADVADFIVKQLESPTFLGKTPLLTY